MGKVYEVARRNGKGDIQAYQDSERPSSMRQLGVYWKIGGTDRDTKSNRSFW